MYVLYPSGRALRDTRGDVVIIYIRKQRRTRVRTTALARVHHSSNRFVTTFMSSSRLFLFPYGRARAHLCVVERVLVALSARMYLIPPPPRTHARTHSRVISSTSALATYLCCRCCCYRDVFACFIVSCLHLSDLFAFVLRRSSPCAVVGKTTATAASDRISRKICLCLLKCDKSSVSLLLLLLNACCMIVASTLPIASVEFRSLD